MKDIIPAKKQSPILGLSGMGGGVGSNLGGSLTGPTYIDEVFSTYLYEGNGGTKSIINGIDFTKGGLVWMKCREDNYSNILYDTVRGTGTSKSLTSDGTSAEGNYSTIANLTSFNNNGFSLGTTSSTNILNENNKDFTSWSFRESKGFFDVVTYTGTGSARTISHSLGSVPGTIMVKQTSSVNEWAVYHKDLGTDKYLFLQSTDAALTSTAVWNDTAPTATHFSVGAAPGAHRANTNGETYVAYIFAGGASSAATARSVDFDGSGDTLSIPSNALFNDIDGVDFTMECYAKFDSHGSHDGIIHNVTNSGWTGGSWVFEPVSGVLNFYYYNASSTGHVVGGSIPIGQWQHMAITKSGRTITIYQDGIKTGSGNISGNIRTATNPLIIGGQCVGADMDGKVSNVRITIGQVLYTSSFIPSTQPLTTTSQGATASNVKLLCCNDASVTGSTVTTGTITANGNPAPSTNSPFDDPDGFKFGEEGDQNIIKTGSYKGNGNADGPEVFLGWEPQWVLVKNTNLSTEQWFILDSMRGIVSGASEIALEASRPQAEAAYQLIDLTATGFKVTTNDDKTNNNNGTYIYMAIRRPDPLVVKAPEAASDVFNMDTGAGSSTIPNFDSGFPVDFALVKKTADTQDWYTNARLTGVGYMVTNDTQAESNSGATEWITDSNVGWNAGTHYNSDYQSWMWKRGVGFDVVTYKGNGTVGRQIPHNLSKTPEMIWVKNRSISQSWPVYHKGLNGGTTPWEHYIYLNGTSQEVDDTQFWNDTAPTSRVVTTGGSTENNHNGSDHIMMLFASVDGISKVGYYTGDGSESHTITTGFTPRFLIIRVIDAANSWYVFDSVRGLGSGNDPYLKIDENSAQSGATQDFFSTSSTGFTILKNWEAWNANSNKYIYYAHA